MRQHLDIRVIVQSDDSNVEGLVFVEHANGSVVDYAVAVDVAAPAHFLPIEFKTGAASAFVRRWVLQAVAVRTMLDDQTMFVRSCPEWRREVVRDYPLLWHIKPPRLSSIKEFGGVCQPYGDGAPIRLSCGLPLLVRKLERCGAQPLLEALGCP